MRSENASVKPQILKIAEKRMDSILFNNSGIIVIAVTAVIKLGGKGSAFIKIILSERLKTPFIVLETFYMVSFSVIFLALSSIRS